MFYVVLCLVSYMHDVRTYLPYVGTYRTGSGLRQQQQQHLSREWKMFAGQSRKWQSISMCLGMGSSAKRPRFASPGDTGPVPSELHKRRSKVLQVQVLMWTFTQTSCWSSGEHDIIIMQKSIHCCIQDFCLHASTEEEEEYLVGIGLGGHGIQFKNALCNINSIK